MAWIDSFADRYNTSFPMAASQEPNANPSNPPAQQWALMAELKSDTKMILNQALYNTAVVYPLYYFELDKYLIRERDSDWMAALKMGALMGGVFETQKLLRRAIVANGFNPRIASPFG